MPKAVLPIEFPRPTRINYLVCCDMDETYIPVSPDNKALGGVAALETFLRREGEARGIVIGWITGTNKASALRKANGYISQSLHFLCCSLGTEFYWIQQGQLVPSESWQNRIASSGYCPQKVDKVIAQLVEKGITLVRQPADYQGPYKQSFYYQVRAQKAQDFALINQLAEQAQVKVLMTKSNPAAGDPEDSYDIEFIPLCCGKDQALLFLQETFQLPSQQILAFGDSANDFSMFAVAGAGYLVANADQYAIQAYGACLDKPYCHGILSVLTQLNPT